MEWITVLQVVLLSGWGTLCAGTLISAWKRDR